MSTNPVSPARMAPSAALGAMTGAAPGAASQAVSGEIVKKTLVGFKKRK